MKIRLGFVSNSSSASFTLVWKVLDNPEYTVEEAVSAVMEYDSDKEEVIKFTRKNEEDNTFISRFWTCMLNCPSDIGSDATSLYFSLAMNKKRFKILKAKLDEDD